MTGGASSFHRNVIVLLLSVATLLRVAVAADFAVLHPTTGDTLTVGVRFNITWTNNSQSDVTISLLKEEPVGNRSLVYILACTCLRLLANDDVGPQPVRGSFGNKWFHTSILMNTYDARRALGRHLPCRG